MKPDNVMFDEFGQVLLTDFGIAKAMSGGNLTGTGMSIGTPHYMSPEQARAQPIDGRSDIYSLGVMAYQCLTGTVPFDGEDSFAIGYKHITEPLPPLQLQQGDDRQLFETIRRMMMKDPADRPQDCAELVASLQRQPTSAPGSLIGADRRAGSSAVSPATGRRTTPIPPVRTLHTPRSGTRRAPTIEPKKSGPAWPLLLVLAAERCRRRVLVRPAGGRVRDDDTGGGPGGHGHRDAPRRRRNRTPTPGPTAPSPPLRRA